MAFELEALVGHLYVAGGRTIKTTPPGALCEVAPRRAARGREIDTIFVMVLPSGTIAPNTFYEQMALMAAERYFSQSGSVTSALREVLNTLNHNLHEHNQSGRKHYEANMLIAVLRADTLYTARVGATAFVLLNKDGTKNTVPSDLTNDEQLFKAPLGVQPIPDVEMGKFPVSANARLLLTDANIAEITDERLLQALKMSDIEKMLDEFKTLVTLQIQMMAIEFVPPEQPALIPVAAGQSTAVLSAEMTAARSKMAAEQAAAQAAAAEAKLLQQEENSSRRRLQKRVQGFLSAIARSTGNFFTAIGNLLTKLFGREPSENTKRRRSTLSTLIMIAFPIVLISVVVLFWVFNVGRTAYEDCVSRVSKAADVARTIDSSLPTNVLVAWQATQRIINECRELRPDVEDTFLQTLELESQLVIDNLNGISRRDATQIYWWEGANIRTMILQGLDLYALDSVNNLVYRVQLSEDGMSIASTPQPIVSMRQGARVDGLVIGRIVDIVYDIERNQIVALDENGVMIHCPPRFINQCEAQALIGTENWLNPTRIGFFGVNFYVMDSGGEQIWRFQPVGTTDNYGNPPQEYFQGSGRYPLQKAVDFEIGTIDPIRGKIFILYDNGSMTAHFNGEPEPFTFGNFREGLNLTDGAPVAMFLNNNRLETVFYIVSRNQRTVYETTAAGTFIAAYRVTDESLFERVNDVVADTEQGVVYVASGNAILAFRRR